MMSPFALIKLPRPPEGGQAEDVIRQMREAHAATRTPVFCTAGWPDQELSDRWSNWLRQAVELAHAEGEATPVLAELPLQAFEQLRASQWIQSSRPLALLDVIGRKHDPGHLLDATDAAVLAMALKKTSAVWAAELMDEVDLVLREGHCYTLPGGDHTDTFVAFGEFRYRTGGDGLLHYLEGLFVRHLVPRKPAAVVYWAAPNHVTFPMMMEKVDEMLRKRGRRIRFVRLGGSYQRPTIGDQGREELGVAVENSDSPLVIATDIVSSGKLVVSIAECLKRDLNVISASINLAAVIDLHAPSAEALYKGRRFIYRQAGRELSMPAHKLVTLDAKMWRPEGCPMRRSSGPHTGVHSEARPRLSGLEPLGHQATRGTMWSTILSGGQVGRPRGEQDHRHLHERYIEPANDHVKLLMRDILPKLGELEPDVLVCHLPNKTSDAIARCIQSSVQDKHIPVVSARKTEDGWTLSVPEEAAGRAIIIDDGANHGLSLMTLIPRVRERGLDPVAFVVWEDKLGPEIRQVIEHAASTGGFRDDGCPMSFLSLHRSSPLDASVPNTGKCRRCLRTAILEGIERDPQLPPLFRPSVSTLLDDLLWSPDKAKKLKSVLEIDPVVDSWDQMNRLLVHYTTDLTGHPRLMDTMVEDYLPDMRAKGLRRQLEQVDERWLSRIALYLDAEDLGGTEGVLVARLPQARVLLFLRQLRAARSRWEFADALRSLADLEAEAPGTIQSVRQDLLQFMVWALTGADDWKSWLRRLTDELPAAGGAPQMVNLIAALEADARFAGRGPNTSRLVIWSPSLGGILDGQSDSLVRQWSGWALDLRTRELRAPNKPGEQIPADEAYLSATAIVGGQLFTHNATAVMKAYFNTRGKAARDRFETICSHVESSARQFPDFPLRAMLKERSTPKSQEQRCLVATDVQPVLVTWNDDGDAMWKTIRTVARTGDFTVDSEVKDEGGGGMQGGPLPGTL